MFRRSSFFSLVLLVATATFATSAAPAGAASYRVNWDFPSALATGMLAPNATPPGANDWSCQPSAAHPDPVVLVHGTYVNQSVDWRAVAPVLANAGFCVYSLNYGQLWYTGPLMALDDMRTSARQLSAFVDRVRASTHAAKVDLVGHSQGGGPMPRYYLKYLGGAAKVDQLVGIAPTNHGTTLSGLSNIVAAIPFGFLVAGAVLPAAVQQVTGSSFITDLNAGGDTMPGVRYTVIATTRDWVATPYTTGFLAGPNVTNLTVQAACPKDPVSHLGMTYDRYVVGLTLRALDPSAPTPACSIGASI